MEKLKDVTVAYLGIKNSNGFELPEDTQILNAGETVPVTIGYTKDKIGVANNFRKTGNKIIANVEVDHTEKDSVFRPCFEYHDDKPEEIRILTVGMLPKSRDSWKDLAE